jgi:hypothetical protein
MFLKEPLFNGIAAPTRRNGARNDRSGWIPAPPFRLRLSGHAVTRLSVRNDANLQLEFQVPGFGFRVTNYESRPYSVSPVPARRNFLVYHC